MEKYNLTQTGQEVQDILDNATPQSDLTVEVERAQDAERLLGEGIQQNATDIDSIEGKIPSAATSENKLTDKEYVDGQVDDEKNRAQGVEDTLQDNIDAEETRAKAAERQNADDIDALEAVVPSGATSENKLATESYVNDAVATSSATFRGTFNLVSDLHLTLEATHANIATALAAAIATADNNDFAFVQIPVDAETPTVIGSIERYKFNGTDWAYEYTLNNSGFTQAEWDAINSGITSGDVAKLAALPTNAQLTTLLTGLQSDIDGEEARAKGAEGTLQDNIDAEEARAKAAEKQNADDIDAIEAVLPENASSENKVATESEIDSLSAAIEAILLLIPTAASSLNQLADKAFVNSSIATATATFRGTYNLVNDLGLTTSATHAQIATALAGAILTADNNDYAFVQIPTSDAMPTEIAKTERYKFNGTAWEYEYDLNNSGFTADQWAAINSGITQALVTKLSALPTNAELTTELGTLTSGINTINQKIPNAASQANKLVDTAAMESYIVEVLNVLTISYNVTSTDGHVTFHIEQVDGKITSVTLTTSDIASAAALNLKASQADLTALEGRVTTAEGNITTLNGNLTSLTGRVSTNETDIAQLQAAYEALTQSDIIIGALPASGVANKIYRVPGTSSYSDYMWNSSTWVLMATYNNAIDPRPKKASQNLVTSGGVFDNMGALDVSELNATENPHTLAQYVDLSAALAAIPTDYQKGGMSIKFIHSYDNKYVQFRYMLEYANTTAGNAAFVNTDNWSLCEDIILVENPEFIAAYTDKNGRLVKAVKKDGTEMLAAGLDVHGDINTDGDLRIIGADFITIDNPEFAAVWLRDGKILFGVQKDANFYFGAGVPKQVIDYIEGKLADLSLDEYEDIVAFINGLETGDKTLAELFDEKVDKEEDKSLIDEDVADSVHYIEDPVYIKTETDSEGKLLAGRTSDGKAFENVGFSTPNLEVAGVDITDNVEAIDSNTVIEDVEERSEITTDSKGKVISYRDSSGVLHEKEVKTDIIYAGNINTIDGITEEFLYVERPKFAEMFFYGTMPTDLSDDRIPTYLDLDFKVDKQIVFKCRCSLAIQGEGTANSRHPNLTFEPFNVNGDALSIKFGDMIATDSFHLKGYLTDRTKSVELGGYRWYGDMLKQLGYPYNKVNNIPEGLVTTYNSNLLDIADAKYHPDGFPVAFYINDLFFGIYVLKLKKTRQNYAMEKSQKQQIFLDAKIDNEHSAYLETPFDYTCWDLKNPKIKNYSEGDPITDATVMASINHLFDFTTDLDNQHQNYSDYIVLPHWICFLIFEEVICNVDCQSGNYNLTTWDGTHWSIIPWDIDRSFVQGPDQTVITTEVTDFCIDSSVFWYKFRTYFDTEIRALYTKLRNSGFLDAGNLLDYYKNAVSNVPREYFKEDYNKWGEFKTNCITCMELIATMLNNKLEYLDTRWLNQ